MADVLRLLVAPPPRLREFIAARLRAAASLRPRHAKHGGGGGGVLAVAAAAVEEAAPAAKAGGLAVVLSTVSEKPWCSAGSRSTAVPCAPPPSSAFHLHASCRRDAAGALHDGTRGAWLDTGLPAPQAMGYLIVVGAVVSRMPQVWKVWRAKACEGLNPLSHEIEMFGYTVCVLNGLRLGLPPDMWGENMFHSSFGTAMVLMIYGFAKPGSRESVSKTRKTAVLAVYAALCVTGFTGILPSVIIHRLYDVQSESGTTLDLA
jgi:hypothetical protein